MGKNMYSWEKLIFFLVAFGLFSCSTVRNTNTRNMSMRPSEYVRWVTSSENGLRVTQTGACNSELQYCPTDYMVVKDLRKEDISKKELQEGRRKYENNEFFELRLATSEGKGYFTSMRSGSLYSYLMSGLQKDIRLVSGKDTIECVAAEVQYSQGILPYDLCLLVFEKDALDTSDMILEYHNQTYFQDTLKIRIKRESIDKMPKIKVQ